MPSTEAGKRIADRLRTGQIIFPADIDDIEAEAVADEKERITREVNGADLPLGISIDYNRGYSAALAAVLAIVNRATPIPLEGRSVEAALADLRVEFLRLLTTDSETKDARRKDFNQAIFNAEGGWAIWSSTDLDMVLLKFDRAVRNVRRTR